MDIAKTPLKIATMLRYGVMAVLVLLPFHALFTTWLGSTFGYLDAFRIWKEVLIALMVPLALWLVYKDRQLRKRFMNSRLVLLVLAYVLLHLALGAVALAVGEVNPEALVFALVINLRFPIFLLLVMVVAAKTNLKQHWRKILLWPAGVVVAFGLLQIFVLPPDFLKHAGYGQGTIPAVQTVDEKPEYQRIQSTLRGANPLGAYLVLIITALVALRLGRQETENGKQRTADRKQKESFLLKAAPSFLTTNHQPLIITAAVLTLFFTYSRSAWLGTMLSVTVLIFWTIHNARLRRGIVVVGIILAVVLSGTVWLLRDNDRVQNTLFHSDENSLSSESSNAARGRHLSEGVRSVAQEPLGRGPGTAGPASVRNDAPARIAENYYIQIAQEAGVIGIALFVAINLLLAKTLLSQRQDRLSLLLLASLIGITLINLLSHAWTDDTLSLLWWGLAGIALAPMVEKIKKDGMLGE